ncbi:MAG: M28 family peptidase [Candidatus Freyrarchaeum guaymaensis]
MRRKLLAGILVFVFLASLGVGVATLASSNAVTPGVVATLGVQGGSGQSSAVSVDKSLCFPCISHVGKPSADEIYQWVADLVNLGLEDGSPGRRSGTPVAWKCADWMMERMIEVGLQDVHKEPIPMTVFLVDDWGLTLTHDGVTESVECYPLQYVGASEPGGTEAEVVYVGSDAANITPEKVAGKIVLADVLYPWIPFAYFLKDAWYFEDPIDQQLYHAPLFSPNLYEMYYTSQACGAVGFIGILADKPYNTSYFYQNLGSGYYNRSGSIPGVFIGRADGDYVRELVLIGSVTANLLLDSRIEPSVDYNVVGVLPGRTDDIIVIGAHYDSTFAGAMDNAVGCGVFLAVAKYLAQFPACMRDKTLVFVSFAGHETGLIGSNGFIDQHMNDIIRDMLVYVNIEHVACMETEVAQVGEENVGIQAARMFAMTPIPIFADICTSEVIENNLLRTIVMTEYGILGSPGDAGPFHARGLRNINMIAGPNYYHTVLDTLDMVKVEELEPCANCFIDIILKLDQIPTDLILTCPEIDIPRQLYIGHGTIKTDDGRFKGRGVMYVTDNMIYIGVEGAGWHSWSVDKQWTRGNWEYYWCSGELGWLLVKLQGRWPNLGLALGERCSVQFLGWQIINWKEIA